MGEKPVISIICTPPPQCADVTYICFEYIDILSFEVAFFFFSRFAALLSLEAEVCWKSQ